MENIIEINVKSTFTLTEVNSLLPVLLRMTESAQLEVKKSLNQLEALPESDHERAQELEKEINIHVEKWQGKVQKLGGLPKGLWLADFDFGEGYFCWKFPEDKITFWHGYKDGFSGRKRLDSLK